MLNRLKQLVDLIHAYPAAAGMVVTAVVAVLAHYGLNPDAAKATGLLVVVDGVVFAWIHGQVMPVVATAFKPR